MHLLILQEILKFSLISETLRVTAHHYYFDQAAAAGLVQPPRPPLHPGRLHSRHNNPCPPQANTPAADATLGPLSRGNRSYLRGSSPTACLPEAGCWWEPVDLTERVTSAACAFCRLCERGGGGGESSAEHAGVSAWAGSTAAASRGAPRAGGVAGCWAGR